ncbi:MAG: hypothetical protein R3D69_00080 [Xanthobacteraceae bacterium]
MRVLGSWSFWVFLTAIVTAAILPMFPSGYTRLIGWAVVAGAVLAVVWTISQSNSRTLVFLVDERNRYELTQLITLAWFVVIVSAYLACALWNIQLWDGRDPRLPIAINVPATVWSLAGIVGVGLVGAGIIKAVKRERAAQPHHQAAATSLKLRPPAHPLFIRASRHDAEAIDLVSYDELGVQDKIDLAALQQLLFQIAAVIIYGVALGRQMFLRPTETITAFPEIPEGFVALLGVSTLTALANRAVPR